MKKAIRSARLFLLLAATGCASAPGQPDVVHQPALESQPDRQQESRPAFSSYDEAVAWYLGQPLETIYPQSTAIYRASYHKGDQVLLLFFKSNPGKGYIYGGVPSSVWQGLKQAPSKGRYYNAVIRGRYGYRLACG